MPPWFGDVEQPPKRIAGKVFGATSGVTVHLLLDVPDPSLWYWRETTTTAGGDFDFGAMRAGSYRLFADGNGWLSTVLTIDTIHDGGDRTELFAYEKTLVFAYVGFRDDGMLRNGAWEKARQLSAGSLPTSQSLGSLMAGFVRRHDGSPARAVGVQPIVCVPATHTRPSELPIAVTTAADGSFVFAWDHSWPNATLCGLRVLMGRRFHEVRLENAEWQSPLAPLLIDLPPPRDEVHREFDRNRRELSDPDIAWLHGRVTRGGVPVPDVHVGAFVLPAYHMEVYDGTQSRSDGSFELPISSCDLVGERVVLLNAYGAFGSLRGRQVVHVRPGEIRNDLELEVGKGVEISGWVVDESGAPVAGLWVAGDRAVQTTWSNVTSEDGSFRLMVREQGRYRLRAMVSRNVERAPPEGRIPPSIDVVTPDAQEPGIVIVVGRTERRHESGFRTGDGYVDLGAAFADGVIQAVGDELAAAGLAVGDEIVGAEHAGAEVEAHDLWLATRPMWGDDVMLRVRRGTTMLQIHTRAPLFGSPPR